MATHHDATETCRLIITRRDATEILLLPNGAEWTLPRVEIRTQQRVAEQLTAETQKGWGLETCCLFVPSSGTSGRNGEAMCAVMESVTRNGKAPAGTYWMPRTVASGRGVAEEARAIRESLAELDSYARCEKLGPFARPGWLRELFEWAQEQVGPLGLRVTGHFRQLNASPTFSLIRLETDDGALWFKATGSPTPMSCRFPCFSPGFFRSMSRGSWEFTPPGMDGCRRRLRAPRSMKSRSFPAGSEWPKSLRNSKLRPSARLRNSWKGGAKICGSLNL